MPSFVEYLQPLGARAVLLSIKPRFSDQIVAGTKRVEFRRAWAKEPVKLVFIYSSAPVQRIVAVAEVEGVLHARPAKLWTDCKARGPGLERQELMDYYAGKDVAFGILLGRIARPTRAIAPRSIIRGFSPPQSFQYLSDSELNKLSERFTADEVPA
nr:ASCH domain-containing protein [uncultured Roseateles sp.]